MDSQHPYFQPAQKNGDFRPNLPPPSNTGRIKRRMGAHCFSPFESPTKIPPLTEIVRHIMQGKKAPDVIRLYMSTCFVSCQGKSCSSSKTNDPSYQNGLESESASSIDSAGCTKLNFLKFLEPKKVKISKTNPSCCPFAPPGCKNGMKYPICSWFASPRYYQHTCSRSTRPQCCRTKCWYYKQLNGAESRILTDANEGPQEDKNVRRTLSSNTLHTVKSVDDLRSWSICCEEQRKYFLEMMMSGKWSKKTRDEGQLENDARDPDGNPMEEKYENLLSVKDGEIERLKNVIRELEGKPERPAPSSMRSSKTKSETKLTTVPSTHSPISGDKPVGILAKSKSTTSAKGVTIEDFAPTKGASSTSLFEKSSKGSLPSQPSVESVVASADNLRQASREPLEMKAQLEKNWKPESPRNESTRGSQDSKSAEMESLPESEKPSKLKSQTSGINVKSESAIPTRKDSPIKTQERSGSIDSQSSEHSRTHPTKQSADSGKSVESKPSELSRTASYTISQQGDEEVIASHTAVSEKLTESKLPKSRESEELISDKVSEKPSESKLPKSRESEELISDKVSEKPSESELPKSRESEELIPDQVSRKSSESKLTKSRESEELIPDQVSRKSSESKLPKSRESEELIPDQVSRKSSESKLPKSRGSEELIPGQVSRKSSESKLPKSRESEELIPGQVSRKSSETKLPKSRESEELIPGQVSRKSSETKQEKSKDSVTSRSAANSRKNSETKSQKRSSSIDSDTGKSSKSDTGAIMSNKPSKQSQISGESNESGLGEEVNSQSSSKIPVRKGSTVSGRFSQKEAELNTQKEKKDSGIGLQRGSTGSGSRRGSITQEPIPEEDEHAMTHETSGKIPTHVSSEHSQAKSEDEENDEPDLFEDEPEDDDIHPVTSSEELSKELFFIEPGTDGIEVIFSVYDGEGKELKMEKEQESPNTKESVIHEDENSSSTSTSPSSVRTAPTPSSEQSTTRRARVMSLAEIGGYEERRKPFLCSCDDYEKPSSIFTHAPGRSQRRPSVVPQPPVVPPPSRLQEVCIPIDDLDLDPCALTNAYETNGIVENNREKLLRDNVAAQKLKLDQFEGNFYNRSNEQEQEQILILRQQVARLEAALAERENSRTQWDSALKLAKQESAAYHQELMRYQTALRQYESMVAGLQQRFRALESGRFRQPQLPSACQPSPQQQLQPYGQPNCYAASGYNSTDRGECPPPPNHEVWLSNFLSLVNSYKINE